MIGVVLGLDEFVVGLEAAPQGRRMFLRSRYLGRYVVVDNPEACRELDRAWGRGQHVTISRKSLPAHWLTSYDTMAKVLRPHEFKSPAPPSSQLSSEEDA